MGAHSAPIAILAGIYSAGDYFWAAWVLVPLVLWIVFEFLGALRGVLRFMARLSGQAPASAQRAAQRVTEAQYAATRNDRQRRQ
jgi:hypothetical protein